jgi:glutamate--cysteine ligase
MTESSNISNNTLAGLSENTLSILDQHISRHGLPIARGIEKEGLRADNNTFVISQRNHPEALGHPLTHSSITTDYSEALLELITPVEDSREDLIETLHKTHEYVLNNIDDEVLWAGSMPCKLNGEESIRIAEYGDSNIGRLKYVYREGLGQRYGRIMQSIAGLHFNFSIDDKFWAALKETIGNEEQSLQDFKSEQYFALIRNFRRYSWLLMYLFGASPCLDQSFVEQQEHSLDQFDDKGTLYKPYATSLRMGDLGYHNNAQSELNICFNNLENFTQTLGQAINTSYPPYEELGITRDGKYLQINTNILQIENEYYSSIRPKRSTLSGETPRHALTERGVEYIEVRCLDLNPFLPLGISEKQIDFMDTFLMFCLLQDSPVINSEECDSLDENFNLAVNEGRRPGLELNDRQTKRSITEWGQSLLNEMKVIAEILDTDNKDNRYTLALREQENKLLSPELTPSAQVLTVMQKESLSWLEMAGELSKKHQQVLQPTQKLQSPPKLKSTNESNTSDDFQAQARKSFEEAHDIKSKDTISFDEFLVNYQNQ